MMLRGLNQASQPKYASIHTLPDGTNALKTTINGPINLTTGDVLVDLQGVYVAVTNPLPDSAGLVVCVDAAAPAITGQTVRVTGGSNAADALVAANVFGMNTRSFDYVFNGTTWDRKKGPMLPAPMEFKAVGTDAYQVVLTSLIERHHINITLKGTNDAIVSLNGDADHLYIQANSDKTFDNVLIATGATITARNATAGSNHSFLAVTVW